MEDGFYWGRREARKPNQNIHFNLVKFNRKLNDDFIMISPIFMITSQLLVA